MAKEFVIAFDEDLPETIEIDGKVYWPDWVEVSTMDDYARKRRVFIPSWLEEVRMQ